MLKSENDLAERNLLITKNLLITLYTEIYPTTYLKYTITSYENIFHRKIFYSGAISPFSGSCFHPSPNVSYASVTTTKALGSTSRIFVFNPATSL